MKKVTSSNKESDVKNNSIKKSKKVDCKKVSIKRNKHIDTEEKINLRKYMTKTNITYSILLLLDVVLIIYLARQNIVNYVVVSDVEIFVSKTRYLLWGRNYINVIVIAFFYIYTLLINKFILHKKSTKKFLILLFIVLVLLNVLLFIIFTKRVY